MAMKRYPVAYPTRQPMQKKRKYDGRRYTVPRILPGELKYLDTAFNGECDTTGTMQLLNGLALGTTAITRIGQQINIKSIQIRVGLNNDQAVSQFGRLMLVVDTQSNGVAPAVTDILVSASYTANRNLAYRKRFKVLMDKVYTGSPTGEDGAVQYCTKYIKLYTPIKAEYNAGNAGTVADIVSNALYFVTVGNAPNPGGYPFGAVVRVRFTDY